jgi:hypothetical protein
MFDPPPSPSRDFILFNRIEAALWLVIALIMLIQSIREPRWRHLALVAAIAFAAFGISDLVETRTGAWWHPWWLSTWKAACVIIFAALLFAWKRRR